MRPLSKTPKPGDIVFAHNTGLMARAIRLGEWLRFRKGSYFNHACVVDRVEDGVAYVIQAEPRGVTSDKTLDSVGEYVLFSPSELDVQKILEFSRAQVGSRYGWLSIVSIVVDLVTPDWFPALRARGTWICSAVTAEALRYGGWLAEWGDIYIVTPAQLAFAFAGVTHSA